VLAAVLVAAAAVGCSTGGDRSADGDRGHRDGAPADGAGGLSWQHCHTPRTDPRDPGPAAGPEDRPVAAPEADRRRSLTRGWLLPQRFRAWDVAGPRRQRVQCPPGHPAPARHSAAPAGDPQPWDRLPLCRWSTATSSRSPRTSGTPSRTCSGPA